MSMETCTEEFARLAVHAPLVRCDSNPILTLHNPFSLQNWTFPVIEMLLIAGAIACLAHGIRWYRRQGDSSNLVVWGSLILALLFIEPITYFPQWFGLEDALGLTFIHNQFSIQFLYDRLPLYIVAIYPVYGYLAYVLVQRTGILKRYNAFISSVCVAFVFMCLFEVVDTVGPQWGWWVWNEDLPTSQPSMGPIPYLSLQAFSLVMPFGIALLTRWVTGAPGRGGRRLARDITIVSIGVWPLFMLMNLPGKVLELIGLSTLTARGISVWSFIVAGLAITAWAFYGAYRARLTDPSIVPAGARGDRFAAVTVSVYLAFGVLFWGAAIPGYLDAVDGVAPSGNPTGSLTFGAAAAVLTAVLTATAYRGTGRLVGAPGPGPRLSVGSGD
ncbi:hypothetical protein A5649_08950 [Mycolicibacter heraklionensis]|uniref:Uncharacterized protein n=1 Tax=Mycolicibacter heraklionensis TaxID=512402 RepID=A0AA91EVG1_9MYCO|nr:hypothetical protein [Mycolicibacter heraklionensis]OBK82453.1 hypothetical protein A5649_08950 [Mycolicibacter heraklionensis]